ncbi:hypothetical protein BJ973_007210 [Actinoplanes tereljensis]|uniref:Uncharacterized protein n=1 Tax=Paractinoplanes tereljensis TaxID=571912 RepID=A0A919TYJ9_9ACTN|nr:hypothetical protein [Actinoplanes tereljensis]GIF24952.1 hypothetical protein Ate02nite_76820 [Actinoplanes tereljensis]
MTGAEFREVDIDLLADYIGGALSGTPDESSVAALIADDPAWRAAYESLSGGMATVGAQLGALEPMVMPDDVVARLEAALASPIAAPDPIPAELAAPPVPHLALVRGDHAHDVPQERTTARERGSKPGSARRLRWATPIAIAAGVIAFVGFGLDYLAGRESNSSDMASSSAAGEAQARQNSAAMPGGPQLLASGTDYTASTLATGPLEPFAASAKSSSRATDPSVQSESAPMAAPDQAGSISGDDPLARLRNPAVLQECIDAIAAENSDGPIYPQSVDFARFDGSPALIVRFSATQGSWAWAVGPSCGTGGKANTLDTAPVR